VNPDGSVWIEEKSRIELVSDIRFDEGALLTSLEVIANSAGDALRRLAQLAMRGSGIVPLSNIEEECRRSIHLVAHVMNQDGWRDITEIQTIAFE